jgi:cytochrome oxidase Cu insertion factor (SCO1/SenC/PrrC family)
MPGMGAAPGAGNSLIVQTFHQALLRQGELIFVVLILLVVAWNVLRSLQYSRAVASGERFPAPRPATVSEPIGRKVVRIGFGALWIFDGLLQMQSAMPLGMPSNVIQPAAATSPTWVQHLVGFGVTTWSRHPSAAAASAVWIQLGIGILLLVAPRGLWSRAAGLASVGWGLVVWVFGSAFGSLFAPGLTVLFGAPGAVLIYVVGGVLIALPERAWVGRQLGRIITVSVGVFLLVMAGLQAWPGRGFWQGGTADKPGTLAGMAQQMATTPQPHALSSLVSSFASFDEAHGWGINLFVVIVLAAIGMGLIQGRRLLYPAVVALVVVGVADWIFIEDFGFWGGTGTDPNSMLPLLLLTVTGYLALVRAPAAAVAEEASPAATPIAERALVEGESADVPAAEPRGAIEPVTEGVGSRGRSWWERIDPGYAGRLAAALGAVVIVLVGAAPMAAASVNRTADPILAEAIDGTPNVTAGPAPDFHLVDQRGQPVSLADLRGYAVALTFLDPVCTTDCPIIAQEFRVASQMLGPNAQRAKFVAIVANPIYNTVSAVDAFDRQEGLDSQPNWLFLTGSRSELQSVWNAYGIAAFVSPAGGMVAHSDEAFVIDARGTTRRVLSTDPGPAQAEDQSSFAGLLASQMSQVLHS